MGAGAEETAEARGGQPGALGCEAAFPKESDGRKKPSLLPPPPAVTEQCGLGVSSVRPPRWGPSGTPKPPGT